METRAGLATALHEDAARSTGLDDFGTEDYATALAMLLEAAEDGAGLGSVGLMVLSAQITGQLVSRLRSQAGWQARPDCLDGSLQAPLVIVGVPRTGTTALHKLLSMDDQFQVLQNWMTTSPMPRPPRNDWASQPAFRAAVETSGMVPAEMKAAHFTEPEEADECVMLLAQSFVSNMFGSTFPLPLYDEWYLTQDETPTFQRYADNLRLIGADDDRPWLLKNPSTLHALDALLESFPDARIVHTHRDPAEAIASVCSVLRIVRSMALGGEPIDLNAIGRRELTFWSTATHRAEAVRAMHPESFFDVQYTDLVANPMRVIGEIYERFDISRTPEAEGEMKRWLADNPQGKHGMHEYRADEFGLDESWIRDAFDTGAGGDQ